MKIILSRKGFDSANGGIVSPIFEDGTMVSFPIPSDDEDTYDSLYYNEIQYSQILFRETVKKLKDSGYPDLTVRNLDSVIWNKYQKNRLKF